MFPLSMEAAAVSELASGEGAIMNGCTTKRDCSTCKKSQHLDLLSSIISSISGNNLSTPSLASFIRHASQVRSWMRMQACLQVFSMSRAA